jgi:hypothetical protein
MSVSVLGRDNLVQNLSKFRANVVSKLVTAVEIVQAKVVEHARAKHGKDSHRSGRFETQTGGLEESIQPGKVLITDKEVSGVIEARMPYASHVEYGTSRAKAFPFMLPALTANGPELQRRAIRAVQS